MGRSISFFMFVLLIQNGLSAHAYDPQTHREIAERAAGSPISFIDEVLKDQLGFSKGILERFPGRSIPRLRTIQELIGDGAFSEDIPDTRSLNHFHNPLLPWEDAGLRTLFGLVRGQSSVLWQQRPEQGFSAGGGNWSWQDARRHYLNALTRATKEDRGEEKGRDTAFAEMFEALGHLTHLIQDASVPAHVRNDPHPHFTILGATIGNPDWYEDWIEETRTTTPTTFAGLLNAPPIRPPASIFTPTNDVQAPVPIARLIDSDKFLGENFGVLTDPSLGIAEHTNGNFLSRDTLFKNFALPRQAGLDPDFIVEPEGARFRRYLRKIADGESIDHFVTEGMLYGSLAQAVGSFAVPVAGWYLDHRVHRDYAAKLLPRAVGYSAALLDYFFRGKLEVDLVEDPDDPSLLKLTGTNASRDPLVEGTLTLYADDPNGVRRPATPLDSTDLRDVPEGQPLSSARFQPPENAERFVAVYQGTLGLEKKEGAFPGGIIGKVLGGVRVEEVFSDGVRWKIRTPKGVFLLPLTKAEFKVVHWGDGENLLVARTSFLRDLDETTRFVAYEIQRQPNSVEFKTVETPDGPEVVLIKKNEAVFPFGLPLGTTVQWTQTINYRQRLGRYDRTHVFRWDPQREFYVFDRLELGPLEFETVKAEAVVFTESFPLVLDPAHHRFGDPYEWVLADVAVDASGRLLALVVAELSDPESPPREIPFFGLNPQGELEALEGEEAVFFPEFPMAAVVWAFVDLQEGRILASTADPTITMASQETREAPPWDCPACSFNPPGVWTHFLDRFEGGPNAGLIDQGWGPVDTLVEKGEVSLPIGEVTELQVEEGVQAISADGWLRRELKEEVSRVVPVGFQLASDQDSQDFVYDCGFTSCNGVRWITSESFVDEEPAELEQAFRSRPALGGERLVVIAGFFAPAVLLVWDLGASRAQIRVELPVARHFLEGATSATALVTSFAFPTFEPTTLLIPLEGTKPPIAFPNEDLSFAFTLLDPSFLYHVEELKFYRLQPPLQRTALPAKLADVPGNPIGDYHAIRLP